MATHVYINQNVFIVADGDLASLRNGDNYQGVKNTINSRARFLFGTTPWEEVYDKCTSNIVKEWSKFESDLIAAKDLEAYVLGLSPIYARLDYIEKLINKRNYQEAEKELQVLDHRLSRIINEMTSKQAQIFYEHHNTGVAKP